MKKHDRYIKRDLEFQAAPEFEIVEALDSAVYELDLTPSGQVIFRKINTNYDKLVDLPNTEYDTVVSEIKHFLKPETRAKFEQEEYLYKRGSLLYGPPGTGKTCIVNRVAELVIKLGGVVFMNPNPMAVREAYKVMDSIEPNRLVLAVFEELDELLDEYESELLNLLDGEIQRNNVVYMATTNHIERIPARIRRPGRFSSSLKVKFPSDEARLHYLNVKLKDKSKIPLFMEHTKGFSIDELKETVLAVVCLDQDIADVSARIKETKQHLNELEDEAREKQERSRNSDRDDLKFILESSMSKVVKKMEKRR